MRHAVHRAKAIVRTRVEPKTFFANERTFLQWLQISVLIMFMVRAHASCPAELWVAMQVQVACISQVPSSETLSRETPSSETLCLQLCSGSSSGQLF